MSHSTVAVTGLEAWPKGCFFEFAQGYHLSMEERIPPPCLEQDDCSNSLLRVTSPTSTFYTF